MGSVKMEGFPRRQKARMYTRLACYLLRYVCVIQCSETDQNFKVLTSTQPKRRPLRPIITAKVHSELRPQRSDYESSQRLSTEVWDILDECWVFEASRRPTMQELIARLSDCLPPACDIDHDADQEDNDELAAESEC